MHDGQVPCPYCDHGFSRTLLTQRTRRRRECVKCGKRFTTYERYAEHLYKTKPIILEGQNEEITSGSTSPTHNSPSPQLVPD